MAETLEIGDWVKDQFGQVGQIIAIKDKSATLRVPHPDCHSVEATLVTCLQKVDPPTDAVHALPDR